MTGVGKWYSGFLRNCRCHNTGVPNFQDLMPDDLRWSWCDNNINRAHSKRNMLESSWNQPHQSVKKLSSMRPVPGAKKGWKGKVLVTQSCPTLCDPMDCSPPGFSVYGILQARMLEWVAIPFSRGSSQPRDWTQVSCISGRFFTIWATREVQKELGLLL